KGLGAMINEEELLTFLAKDKSTQNHVHFLLVIGEDFKKNKEDEEFKHRWHVDEDVSKKVHEALRKLYNSLSDNDLIPEADMISRFLDNVKDVNEEYKNEEIIKRWLNISKTIDKNPLGEWGKASSPNINAKGMRDYAFLVIRKHGSPIHFREVAKAISELFNKKAHVATTHNELIKDPRFVLVGRGLYALAEWGYISGVVKDVIKKILEKHGPLPKDKIIEKVLKERYVKENTILVNLQNPKHFRKDKEGRYSIV
ncbi:winged helix-turn-helix domain-containing protein, partial [Candidatus Parcubacteria bacterium]|nr:winged helix-turn-helix domain-containing protein [Candidatus Parcubacteria bacterium]